MKIVVEQVSILHELTIAQEITSHQSNMSIISDAYICTNEDGTITIKATDQMINYEAKIEGEVIEPGEIVVFCDKLYNSIRNSPKGPIKLETTDKGLLIKPEEKGIKFLIRLMNKEQFPEFETISDEMFFSIAQSDFSKMVSSIIFSVSHDESRHHMNGIYMEQNEDGDKLIMVATDGKRLAYTDIEFKMKKDTFKGIIIPTRTFNIIDRMLSGEGNIQIGINDKMIFFRTGDYEISSSLIEGNFPNYKRVIPEQQEHVVEMNRKDMVDALKQVAVFADATSRIIVGLTKNEIIFHSDDNSTGEAEVKLPCLYDNEETQIALNYKFLEEPAKTMKNDELKFEFTANTRAITFHQKDDDNCFHIIMPMQLG